MRLSRPRQVVGGAAPRPAPRAPEQNVRPAPKWANRVAAQPGRDAPSPAEPALPDRRPRRSPGRRRAAKVRDGRAAARATPCAVHRPFRVCAADSESGARSAANGRPCRRGGEGEGQGRPGCAAVKHPTWLSFGLGLHVARLPHFAVGGLNEARRAPFCGADGDRQRPSHGDPRRRPRAATSISKVRGPRPALGGLR
jgi:hypothetical protein